MRVTDSQWPPVDCSTLQLCSMAQWIHLAYGWSSTRNRRPFRAPEPQKCLHLPELGCVCSRWKLLGLFEVSTRNASIYRTVYNTRPSGRGPVCQDTLSSYIQGRCTIKKKKSGPIRGKLDILQSLSRANLKIWISGQFSEILSCLKSFKNNIHLVAKHGDTRNCDNTRMKIMILPVYKFLM